jgi:hypothetical protein
MEVLFLLCAVCIGGLVFWGLMWRADARRAEVQLQLERDKKMAACAIILRSRVGDDERSQCVINDFISYQPPELVEQAALSTEVAQEFGRK